MSVVCKAMGVSKSGYYKWKKCEIAGHAVKRAHVVDLVARVHEKHRTHGYRWVREFIRINYGESYTANYIYKAFRYLGITAETRHKAKKRPRKIQERFPNLIYSTWETVDRPRQVIVSDMTSFKSNGKYYELTMYFDVFTKEILSWRLGSRRGDRNQYLDGLKDIVELLDIEEIENTTIVHTDQGSVYSSKAYNELIKDRNIERSMSRAGKPTDNPVNESLNGWIKEELLIDFNLSRSDNVTQLIEDYVNYYNNQRPCYAIGYDTPYHYYEKYQNDELEHRDTFSKRDLSEAPKFVRKRQEKKKKE